MCFYGLPTIYVQLAYFFKMVGVIASSPFFLHTLGLQLGHYWHHFSGINGRQADLAHMKLIM
jgi:hypothetical protein